MIITCRKHIPFSWMLTTAMTGAIFMYMYCAMGGAFLFSLKKFLDNPAGLTLIMSTPAILHLFFAPFINFMSDRIWTRYGRRKPFALAGWIVAAVSIAAMPLMPNFWLLILAYLGFQVALDLRGPMDPLGNEIVPPWQRGRYMAISQWMTNFAQLTFAFLALGRFDDKQFYLGIPLDGESSIYWSTCAGLVVLILFIALGIKETYPKSNVRGQKFTMKVFFTSILNKNLFPVYFLIFGSAMMNAGLGTIGALLYTDQWQFTKQEMGNNNMVGGLINMVLIVILGVFADKMNRIKSYQVLMTLTVLVNFSFYLYVNFFLYDRRPILLEVIMFGETLSIMGILIGMVYQPMVFDYVPRNEMGTYMAGSGLLNRLVGLITLNGVGLFIWAYATLMLPPGGDMTRVVFAESKTTTEVRQLIDSNQWTDAVSGESKPASQISNRPWYGSGAYLDFGTAYEIRMSNPDSVKLKGKRDEAEADRVKLVNEESNLQARIRFLSGKNPNDPALANLEAKLEKVRAELKPFAETVERIDAEIAKRGKSLHDQVVRRLGSHLLPEGQQIMAAQWETARLLVFPAKQRVHSGRLERVLLDLRRKHSEVIDMRPARSGDAFAVALSLKSTTTPQRQAEILEDLRGLVKERLGKEMEPPTTPLREETPPLLVMDVKVIEEPMDIHLSPVAKLVRWVTGMFTLPPGPDRKIMALARALRKPGETEHVTVENIPTGTTSNFAMRIFAVISPALAASSSESPANDAITSRLQSLLGEGSHLLATRRFFDRLVLTGKDVRLNVPQQELTSGFAPQTYDYMAGYLWMFGLGIIGLVITFIFAAREKKGLIRKRGLEEASAHSKSGQQHHLKPDEEEFEVDPATGKTVTYTPGYVPQKFAFLAIAACIFLFGAVKLVPDLHLIATGKMVQAEVVGITKTREGLPDEPVTQDEQWKSLEILRDRSSTYWNEFAFVTEQGAPVKFRSTFGSMFRPLNPLLDEDGLPSTQRIVYDPANPQRICQPFELSNWFIPLAFSIIGLAGMIVALLLLIHARRPIPVPFIPEPEAATN
jgi:Na+/melibiose symporter-like transporter